MTLHLARQAPRRTEDVHQLLDRLAALTSVDVEARWLDAEGCTSVNRGHGQVTVRRDPEDAVTVLEEGRWEAVGGQPLRFRGAYRWRAGGDRISVAHVRQGEDRAVPLLDLVPVGEGVWVSETPHLCGEDSYHARLRVASDGLVLKWVVRGPAKAYTLLLRYAGGHRLA